MLGFGGPAALSDPRPTGPSGPQKHTRAGEARGFGRGCGFEKAEFRGVNFVNWRRVALGAWLEGAWGKSFLTARSSGGAT